MAGIGLGDFGAAKIFACTIFGAIGFAAFFYGRKERSLPPTIIGIALMAYPYFFSSTPAIYLIGILLTAALYFWRA